MNDPLTTNRRLFLATGACLLAPVGSAARAQPVDALTPVRCADFLASIGVNTHINYLDSQYKELSGVRDALRYTGVRYVRDGSPVAEAAGRFETLAADGVSFCLFLGPKRDMAEQMERIATLEASRSGAVHALEGPNEIKPNFVHGGQTGNAAGQQFMIDMRAAMAAAPQLRRKRDRKSTRLNSSHSS